MSATQYVQTLGESKRLQRLLGQTTADNELLKEAVEIIKTKNGLRVRAHLSRKQHLQDMPLLHLSRSRVHVLLKRSADWQGGHKARNNKSSKRVDDELEGDIKDALIRFSSFGYERVTAMVNRKRCQKEKTVVNTKRV